MALGLVKCFDARKGSGLITPDGGGPEVFVHVSAVERAGLSGLDAGDRVSFDAQVDRSLQRRFATNLERL